MLGENPLVSLGVREAPQLWTARMKRLSDNLYRCAIRETAVIIGRLTDSPDVQVLLQDDLRGVIKALRGKACLVRDATLPGKVLVDIVLDAT